VSDVGGLNIAYIADPKSAVKLKFAVGPQFDFPILASSGLAQALWFASRCRRYVLVSIRSRSSKVVRMRRCSSTQHRKLGG
jgi:hypothetical protein